MNDIASFRPQSIADIDAMVASNPLALVISSDGGDIQATPLPLVLQRNAAGEAVLIGHFSIHNPQVAMIRRNPRALVAFSGVQGYVSSAWLSDRRYAPTWNYQAVHFEVDIQFDESPGSARHALQTLVETMDADEAYPWRIEESPRAEMLMNYIVPFTAVIRSTTAQFKLGQTDPESPFDDAVKALHEHGNNALADAMLAARPVSAEQAA